MSQSQAASLLQGAQDDALISQASLNVLTGYNLGTVIQQSMGVPADDVDATESVVVYFLGDDSGSIAMANNTQHLIDGFNLILDALTGAANKDGILLAASFFNAGQHCPFTQVENVERLNTSNFRPAGGTPLRDRFIEAMGAVTAKVQELRNANIMARGIVALVTDGDDVGSRSSYKDCATLAHDLGRQEIFMFVAMGIDDGQTDFAKEFEQMGIPPSSVLTPANSPKEIRASFQTMSQSASTASQSAAAFAAVKSQAAAGGFASP